jgi:hypothetical protein
VGKILKALDAKWHTDCFRCARPAALQPQRACRRTFSSSVVLQLRRVQRPVELVVLRSRRCATRRPHPTHLHACPLTYSTADNVYCTKDYEEKFAVRCAVCRETGAAA